MTSKWLKSDLGMVFYGAFLGLLLTGLLWSSPNTALAACSGNACNGQDAGTVECSMNSTIQQFTTPFHQATVELRRSVSCNAKWARTTNTSGAPSYAGATTWWPPYGFP